MNWQKSYSEQSNDGLGNLTYKLNQLKKQVQAERVVSVKVSHLCIYFKVL